VNGADAAHLVQTGGPWAALLGVVLAGLHAIRAGQLVPRTTLDVLIKQYEARITETAKQADARIRESHERELAWRSAAEADRQAALLKDDQLGRLMVLGETTVAILKALPAQRS